MNLLFKSKLPCIGHHNSEVFIIINGSRHISVVVTELRESDNSVRLLCIPKTHILHIDILWFSSSLKDLRMLTDIVDLSNIIQLNKSILVHIQLLVCLSNVTGSNIIKMTL